MRTSKEQALPSSARRLVWCWPNFLCLDAPCIAIIWWLAFSFAFEGELVSAIGVALFAAVWLIYLADRLIDVQQISNWELATARHRFAKRHQGWLRIMLGIAIGSGATVAFWILPKSIALFGVALGVGVSLYFFLFVLGKGARKESNPSLFGKEIACGLFFAIGTAAGQPAVWQAGLTGVVAILLFGLVCCFNCLLISANEDKADAANDQAAATHRWKTLIRDLRPMGFLILVGLAVAGFFFPNQSAFWIALGGSQIGLLLLRHYRSRITDTLFRCLVDATLLTPLLIYPWLLPR